MNILVTGHAGFIGQHMMARLTALGHAVEGYEWDEQLFPEVEGLDAVIHLGAISATTYPDLEQIMRQNYDFSVRLLHACIDHQVPFQYASSASVYGQTTHFTEDGVLAPQSYYAWTKYLFDRYARDYLDRGIAVTGLRYFNVFGHSGEEHKGGMSSPYHKFREQAVSTGAIKLFRNSDQYLRDFV
ncbi:MAG: NAD-dependent epimerase/dehydratase family protein, partial [Alphaproteobacteria bacterium]|nr:NAD-dependent epimerase/dehydratase family protein [Alphaproteobacteria bacterium]